MELWSHLITRMMADYRGVATRLPIIPLHHRALEPSHALPVRPTPRDDPVIPGTMRHSLSNAWHAPTTPETVTLSHHPAITCLPHGPSCPIRRKVYGAYRSESMPHGVIKRKPPHNRLYGGSVRENPVYQVLLSLHSHTNFSVCREAR